MKLSETVKPISYLKAHASEILRDIKSSRRTMVITQNGEATAVLQDIKSFEELHESLALLKILAISNKNKNEGQYKSLEESFEFIKKSISEKNKDEL
ncbi:type II toxin-antitoxin system Phd/YefM family antitoxin [candidate division KSB1 bacterium]|nr:type II toxin-antitoxin system Phd/YefM family antitoxin [candidate division KSB1 bacterium]